MLDVNVSRLMKELSETEVVLDVGGWACPFNRAQWILDAQPYDTRGFYRTFGGAPSQGGDVEWFTRSTWIQRDICSHDPWPFRDKEFDFVVCSHTLEDLRDPLWVCRELIRVAKAGYIEVPSRLFETIIGMERPGQAGLSHHRWLVDVDGTHISFLQKYHMIHADWRFHLPHRVKNRVSSDAMSSCLWWRDSFTYEEREIHGLGAQQQELERFVRQAYPRSEWQYRAHGAWRAADSLLRRAQSWAVRHITRG